MQREWDEVKTSRAEAIKAKNAMARLGASVDDALALIMVDIIGADDPFKAGGDWIAKFTNRVSETVREEEEERNG